MADGAGDETAVLLLRALPAEVVEVVLKNMDEPTAARLRGLLRDAPAEAPPGPEIDGALAHFFDLMRIAERSPPVPEDELPIADTEAPPDPMTDLRSIPPDRLARALSGEQPGTVVLILSCLDPTAAGQVMKYLPLDARADIAVRMTKVGPRNPTLLAQLTKAVAEKARRLGDLPPEPTADELVTNLADMLRAVPRAERLPIVQKIETTDPDLAAKVLEKLYRIEDLLRIPDRMIQILLSKLDVKTIATALKNADPAIQDKITANMSSRSRTALSEESELLRDVPASRVKEARTKVLALVKKGEEDGEIVLEE
jgi:flagellar motor switch protein FliG